MNLGEKMKYFVTILLTLVFGINCCAQFIPADARPSSIGDAFKGVKSYDVNNLYHNGREVELPGNTSFIEAYFLDAMRKYFQEMLPDADAGWDFRYPSTTQIFVTAYLNSSTYQDWSGRYHWRAYNIKFEIRFGFTDNYVYNFYLPNLDVIGNNFDNQLYNSMIRNIYGYICHYDSRYVINLERNKTNWNEYSLKKYYDDNADYIEGIYESTQPANGNQNNKYKLGVIRNPNDKEKYILIYLDGQNIYQDWIEGEVKAFLTPSATDGVYKAEWKTTLKNSTDGYVYFNEIGLKTIINGTEESYLKLYPTTTKRRVAEEANNWSGTGFALKDGYIVTNNHVVDGAKSVKVQGIRGVFNTEYSADVVATDKNNDLAIIKINDTSFNGFGTIPYRIKTQVSEVGEDVFVLGYPLTSTMGDEIKLTTGVISSRTGFQGDVSLYQISAPIQPGNSGGPLFDGNGNIIGIVNAKHTGAENVGYAIKTSYLNNLVESESTTSASLLPTTNSISAMSLSNKVKSVKNFVFMIKCSNVEDKNNTNVSSNRIVDNSSDIYNDEIVVDKPMYSNNVRQMSVEKVILSKGFTAVKLRYENKDNYKWVCIDKNTYIATLDGKQYTLTKADDIQIAPNKTYLIQGMSKTFWLYFPPIPVSTTVFDLIEPGDSPWKFYGIKLK